MDSPFDSRAPRLRASRTGTRDLRLLLATAVLLAAGCGAAGWVGGRAVLAGAPEDDAPLVVVPAPVDRSAAIPAAITLLADDRVCIASGASCRALPGRKVAVAARVNGVPGSGVVLTLNGGTPIAVAASGEYVFQQLLPVGAGYAVELAAPASAERQDCAVERSRGYARQYVTFVQVRCGAGTPVAFATR